jgi:transcriptional regulator with XRE-family HTH domain
MQAARLLREARRRSGHSLRSLARQAKTSHATLAAYENGRKDPSLTTIGRIVGAAGLRIGWELKEQLSQDDRPLTRQEARSLAYHLGVARRLLEDPDAVLSHGRETLARMRTGLAGGHSDAYLDAWQRLLDGPTTTLLDVLTSPSERARDLRPVSPFAGLLSEEERQELRTAVHAP